jgi:hypothetical protein
MIRKGVKCGKGQLIVPTGEKFYGDFKRGEINGKDF